MELAELLKKRVIFVSGKGGCGKTSISMFLALMAEQLQKNVLIVEMNSTGRVAPLFEKENSGPDVTEMTSKISVINLSPKHCFEDYAVSIIYFHTLYKAFLNNSYVNNFLNAAPGLKEFLMLRKICEFEDELEHSFFSKEPKYDIIIVDAPATGHGLSVLEVPQVLANVTKIGPLYSQANRIMTVLGDEEKTAFCVVTLAEEMPVCESEEYIAALREGTNLHFGPMFVNSLMPEVPEICWEELMPTNLELFADYYNLSEERYELNLDYLEEIENRFPNFNKIMIPFQFHGLNTTFDFRALLNEYLETLRD